MKARVGGEGYGEKDQEPSLKLFDDQPIQSRSEDRLGRAEFVDTISRAICGWRGRKSLVIGLYGRWGSGKSSVKNMVCETLKEAPTGPVRVVEFNPWQFANREQLTQVFFDQVGIGLGRRRLWTFGGRARAAARWRRYAGHLRSGKDLVSVARSALLIGGLAVVLGIGTFEARWIALTVGGIAILLGLSARCAEAILGFLTSGDKSLEEVREEIAKDLKELSQTLVVIVDDIDRLTPAETAEMLQVIKVNADFPNLVYLVLFDQRTVEKHIMQALDVCGREYLEKVVQAPFEIPAAEPVKLHRVLSDGLEEFLVDAEVAQRFDPTRWGNLFFGGIEPYFRTLRDVKRFLSTVSFHIAAFRSHQAFEVNPIDLIALEALRMFEPVVYGLIRENKAALTGQHQSHQTDQAKEAVLTIVNAAPEGHEAQVKELVNQLFPTARWALGGSRYTHGFYETWERDLRVCSDDIFDRYFVLTTPEGEISETELVGLLAATGDRTAFRDTLRKLATDGRLRAALERLEAYKQKINPRHAKPLVTALFDVSDHLPRDHSGMLEASAQMHAIRIVHWYLKPSLPTYVRHGARKELE